MFGRGCQIPQVVLLLKQHTKLASKTCRHSAPPKSYGVSGHRCAASSSCGSRCVSECRRLIDVLSMDSLILIDVFLCSAAPEVSDHLLVRCAISNIIWSRLLGWAGLVSPRFPLTSMLLYRTGSHRRGLMPLMLRSGSSIACSNWSLGTSGRPMI